MSTAKGHHSPSQKRLHELAQKVERLRLDFKAAIRLCETAGDVRANSHLVIAVGFLEQINQELSALRAITTPTPQTDSRPSR
jgi:hypothetical protein